MCLSLATLVTFLNILGAGLVTTEPGRITVHAAAGDAVWVRGADGWCTMAPYLDRLARFDEGYTP